MKPETYRDAEAVWEELSRPTTPERETMAGAAVRRARSRGLRSVLPERPKRGLRRGVLFLLTALLLLLLLAGLLAVTAMRPPKIASKADRVDGKYTFLLAGTDQDGVRTDAMMLCAVDVRANTASVMSLPRDTLLLQNGSPRKLNAVYADNGMGREGMEALSAQITRMLGIPVDGYALVSLSAVEQLVDQLGGVWFDVPTDMRYEDPWQDLFIDLHAGYQLLDGKSAVQLLRYRSGYYNADLGRVEVQQGFLKAMLQQTLRLRNLPKVGGVMQLLSRELTTDLTAGNLGWLALHLRKLGSLETDTMPGSADGILLGGQNYFVIYGLDTLALLNERYSPLQSDITLADTDMMRLSGKAIVDSGGTYYASVP